ncbi:hypothetical protein MNEG_9726 [Monoraphidium neglectum]|uniref:glucan endo-1,3-beta-D-glucosidase n=1 Tax=Monoraphidium neglectum TaxID=145388 RepID=A0A0D2MBJ8_9CHLO|nr:hypothetical protein MNEG_9726 [Monoraphidium neglectum]KIY98236.1 hypothetical protein MNEG_9726 [Monoraphidium neglectum]|eukprot:XP_013897256.1 hypothetical protein MNEG_9726 [Monoraphidium neglectum]
MARLRHDWPRKALALAAACVLVAAALAAPTGAPAAPRRRLQAAAVSPGASGSNAPGAFTGGPSLTMQHSGAALDNPMMEPVDVDAVAQQQSGSGSSLNLNLARSLTNDMMFAVKYGNHGQVTQAPKTGRRLAESSLDGEQLPEGAHEIAELDPSTFDLSPELAAKQAAEQQALEAQLFSRLAARAKGDVTAVEGEMVRAASVAAAAAPGGSPAEGGGANPGAPAAKKHRKSPVLPTSPANKGSYNGRPLYGVTYSWRRAEECDAGAGVCQCPTPDELEEDLDLIHKYATRFRTYSVECPDVMRMLLHFSTVSPEFKWAIGLWVGRDEAAVRRQITLLGQLLEGFPNANVYAIVVGSEAVSRGDATEVQLISYIKAVRSELAAAAARAGTPGPGAALTGVPVMTAEVPWAWTPRLAAAVDIVGANIHPFYGGKLDTTSKRWTKVAVGSALQHYSSLATRLRPKPVVVTEVGWPSASGPADVNGGAPAAAAEFARAWVKAAQSKSVPYFYHELTDSAWKTKLRLGAGPGGGGGGGGAGGGSADGAGAADGGAGGVLADEHFGLVGADRLRDKGLLLSLQAE